MSGKKKKSNSGASGLDYLCVKCVYQFNHQVNFNRMHKQVQMLPCAQRHYILLVVSRYKSRAVGSKK